MATANQIIESLADALGRTASSVEAYALWLRRTGRWAATKRGRGATPITDGEAAKLLLAVMSDGSALSGWWLECANLALLPDQRSDPMAICVREALGLPRSAKLLDYLQAIVAAFRTGTAHEYFAPDAYPIGCLDRETWLPGVELTIAGPNVRGEIAFWLTEEMLARANGADVVHQEPMTPQKLIFVHELIGWREDALESGDDLAGFDAAIAGLAAERSKGVRYRRTIGSTEIEAVAAPMRSLEDRQ